MGLFSKTKHDRSTPHQTVLEECSSPWSERHISDSKPEVKPSHSRWGKRSSHGATPLFPRYGHSVSTPGSLKGQFFISGGLVDNVERDDLFSISMDSLSVLPLETKGNRPSPRLGHSSALIRETLVLWGGDTGTADNSQNNQDNDLYLLNTVSLEWTRLSPPGPAPSGRYGHSMAISGTQVYIFGGQSGAEFFNELWMFDFASPLMPALSETLCWTAYNFENRSVPSPRTNHVCVAHDDRLIIFGGTDSHSHFSDTWSFDIVTGTWTEMECGGTVPSAREGHAAALVGDTMYVFGGRDVGGRDIGDLLALDLTRNEWHIYPRLTDSSPSARSGHSLAAFGKEIFLLGGESFTPVARHDPPDIVHVLHTDAFFGPPPPYKG